tara:strand:- start:127 stop:420 length:294 start_codon:yes stop_codon:yes gene_type:complete
MIIGRIIGYLCLSCFVITLGAEGLRFLEGNSEGWISIIEVFNFFEINQIEKLNSQIENSKFSRIWQDIFDPVLNFSALFSFLIIGFFLIFITRDRIR